MKSSACTHVTRSRAASFHPQNARGTSSPLATMGKARINKVNQKTITFDEGARKDFITGFHKRRNERRQLARNKVAKQVRQERLESRAEKRVLDQERRGFDLGAGDDEDDGDEADQDEPEAATAELQSFLTGGSLTTTVVTPLLDEPEPAAAKSAAPKMDQRNAGTSTQQVKSKKFNLSVPLVNAIPGYQLPAHFKGIKKQKKKKKVATSKKDKARARAPRRE